MKRYPPVLIFGITGQDGSYLAELLLKKKYDVHGVVRRVAIEDPLHRMWRIKHILGEITLHHGDITSYASVANIIKDVQPEEIYHVAAQSFVGTSFDDELSTMVANQMGTTHILSAARYFAPRGVRIYNACSSEMFGNSPAPQSEETPFMPRSPYGVSKVAAFHTAKVYREAHGLHVCNGILFNHESPRRGKEFVTRKITSSLARFRRTNVKLKLGNLDARRDWGYAPEYVEMMWKMLVLDKPDDYVIATGETNTVHAFLAFALDMLDLKFEDCVEIDKSLERPAEVHELRGNAAKAGFLLNWKPKVTFKKLVEKMVRADAIQETLTYGKY